LTASFSWDAADAAFEVQGPTHPVLYVIGKNFVKKKITLSVLILLATLACVAAPKQKAEKRLQSAAEVLQKIMNVPDKSVPMEVVEHAKCIAVIPHEIKAASEEGIVELTSCITLPSCAGLPTYHADAL
jgi:hypothetical protein